MSLRRAIRNFGIMLLLVPALVILPPAEKAQAACLSLCTCTTSATSVIFGTYNPLSGSTVSSNGTVTVQCSLIGIIGLLVGYSIQLSNGTSGSNLPRRMTGGAYSLAYNLFTDGSYGTVWGDNTGGTADVSDGYLLDLIPQTRNYTIYGRIPANQNVPPGPYVDTIIVTVNF